MDMHRLEGASLKRREVFCCYARKDQSLLHELIAHLAPLQREGLITIRADIDIAAGMEWKKEISRHLNTAQIILLLISPDFIASDYCYSNEMHQAMKRHERGEARVIPIILRPVHWQRAPFSKLQALPANARPITDRKWHNRDEAFYNVIEGIRHAIEVLEINNLDTATHTPDQREGTSDPPLSRNQAPEDDSTLSRSPQVRSSSAAHHVSVVPSTRPRSSRRIGLLSGLISVIALVLVITSLLVFRPGKEPGRGLGGTPTGTPPSVPMLVQKSFQNQHADFIAVAFPSSVTPGDLIVVAITQFKGTVSSVTDNHNNTYVQIIAAQHANTSTDFVQLYYAKNVAGGATTITVIFSIAGDKNVGVYEYSGLDQISPLDQVISNAGSGNTPDGGILNTTRDNELLFAVGVDDDGNNSVPSAGSGYALENHQDASSQKERLYTEDRIVAHGSYHTDFSIAAASNWVVIGVSFKPAGTRADTHICFACPQLRIYLPENWSKLVTAAGCCAPAEVGDYSRTGTNSLLTVRDFISLFVCVSRDSYQTSIRFAPGMEWSPLSKESAPRSV